VEKLPPEKLKMIKQTQMKNNVSRALAFKWHRWFCNGHECHEIGLGQGRKKQIGFTAVTSSREAIEADRDQTIGALSELFYTG
jgi:hypothetical protein